MDDVVMEMRNGICDEGKNDVVIQKRKDSVDVDDEEISSVNIRNGRSWCSEK